MVRLVLVCVLVFLASIAEAQVGPQPSITCPASSVDLDPGTDIPAMVSSYPPGTTFCVRGLHAPNRPIFLLAGQSLIGESGAIIDGTNVVQGWDVGGTAIISGWNCGACAGVTVRNLVIRNLTAHICIGAEGPGADRWTVDHNEVSGCLRGINLGRSSGHLVTSNHVHHNTENGYASYLGRVSIWDLNEFHHNGHESKFALTTGLTFRRNYVHHNDNGIWFDGEATAAVIEDNIVEDNSGEGIFYEASGQGVIRRNTVRRSGISGIFISTSHDVEIYENVLEDNWRGINYFVNGEAVGSSNCNYIGVPCYLADVSAHDNTVRVGSRPESVASSIGYTQMDEASFATYLNGSKNLTFSRNAYVVPDVTRAWWFWGGWKTWDGWQAAGHDLPPPPPPPVADTVAPKVTLKVVRSGQTTNYTATTTASDNVAVTRFELRLNGALKATAPGAFTLIIKTKGKHLVTAQAWDAAGNASGVITQTVVR